MKEPMKERRGSCLTLPDFPCPGHLGQERIGIGLHVMPHHHLRASPAPRFSDIHQGQVLPGGRPSAEAAAALNTSPKLPPTVTISVTMSRSTW